MVGILGEWRVVCGEWAVVLGGIESFSYVEKNLAKCECTNVQCVKRLNCTNHKNSVNITHLLS
jgi:hypothetical protein